MDAGVLPIGSCGLGSVTAPADAPEAKREATIFSLPQKIMITIQKLLGN
jgi:hypothetical protein